MHGRPIYGHDDRFLLIACINCKGVHMKLKIVALAISVDKLIFTNFFDVSQLSYKPSNFLGQTSPMPWIKGLKVKNNSCFF